MAGLLTHLSIATFGFLIGTFLFKNWKYGIAFFLGHLMPDLIDFGITGLFHWKFDPAVIMTYSWFRPLAILGHTWWHWLIFGFVALVVIMMFYKSKKLSRTGLGLVLGMLVFFLAGVGVHLIIDLLIIEKSYWI